MKIKVSEATPRQLDWMVAKCEGATEFWFDTIATYWVTLHGRDRALSKGWAQSFTPSTNWAQGGPIIEREKIGIQRCVRACEYHGWLALKDEPFHDRSGEDEVWGETPLIAAMRCYVTSKMGNEVEVPEELQ